MTPRIAAQRLDAQCLSRHAHVRARELVAWMGAVQAQDYGMAKWALGVRLAARRGRRVADVDIEAAVAKGEILRLHAFRYTWQWIAPEDVRWILALVGPRVSARAAPRYRQLGLDRPTFRRARSALERALRDGAQLTRAEIAAVLERAKVSTTGQRFSHLLGQLELEGALCSGGRRGKQGTYALLDVRVPARDTRGLEEGRAELARRYFTSRGPATLADFVWWTGLPVGEARAAIAAAKARLIEETIDGTTHWRGEATRGRAGSGDAERAHLIPAFDEYLVAYKKRDAVLDPKHVRRINAGGGLLAPVVVLDGRVVGRWRRTLGPRDVAIDLELFERRLPRDARTAIDDATARYRTFLGLS